MNGHVGHTISRIPASLAQTQPTPPPSSLSTANVPSLPPLPPQAAAEIGSSPAPTPAPAGNGAAAPASTRPRSELESPTPSTSSTPAPPSIPPSTRSNFASVRFGPYLITPSFFSPYPLEDDSSVGGDDRVPSSASHKPTRMPAAPTVRDDGAGGGPGYGLHRVRGRAERLLGGVMGGRAAAAGVAAGDDGAAVEGQRKTLCVCDGCFKYMLKPESLEIHKKRCTYTAPPGRKVYQRGAHTIWEVDGAKEKLYSQNLSLFGKLFIDTKTIYFDVEGFLFYVLTEADGKFDHVVGFFSKEKQNFDDYNLACIITFPPYQGKKYGTLMIEFSYVLSYRAGYLGTPERPLSDLGLRSYLSFWLPIILRYLTPAPPSTTNAVPPINGGSGGAPERVRRAKGWEGEVPQPSRPRASSAASSSTPAVTAAGTTAATAGPALIFDPTLPSPAEGKYWTLGEWSRATGLRADDVTLTLKEASLLALRVPAGTDGLSPLPHGAAAARDVFVLTPEALAKAVHGRLARPQILSLQHVRFGGGADAGARGG